MYDPSNPEFQRRNRENMRALFDMLLENRQPEREDDEATDRIREADERRDDKESTEELPGGSR
jgi:hypothetical protein